MATKEFYIRNADETDARGPFSVEQITSMGETGQVSPETLYYDANAEKWIFIKDDPEVKALIFPEKKKLTIKKPSVSQPLNGETDMRGSIDVTDMLAAAEGRTEDTKSRSAGLVMADRCAKYGLWGCILMLLLAAASEILPNIDVFTAFAPAKLIASPLPLLGLLDLIIAVLLLLGVVSTYPVVRFRAMLGLGFMGFIFYCQGQISLLAAVVSGSVGLYLTTIFLSYGPMFFALLLGLGGMGALAFLLIF
jgi:hypothetical protein